MYAGSHQQAKRSGAPSRLTRATSRQARANRRAALRDQPSPRPNGKSVEECPFASTREGGSGATTGLVPSAEQNYQGGVLSQFYRRNGVDPGDAFEVERIP
ncbi:NucA/NucB deoxyribonuclease domain-containing protein [Propioniferax innocua]|uniref:NucA/NucB deoxyribonuclease domain-containing protein n=1 Tax=Propioniferax innocua TaxID=1753 RepID=UPI00114E760D